MRKPKILNVDDRELNRYIRSQVLAQADYDVIEAARGREALEKSLSESPDLILLDVNLPDVNGIDVCRLLKTDSRTSGIMVVQISASAVKFSDAVVALNAGADDYLVEPVEPELLLAKVRSMLRLRAAEQLLRRTNETLQQFAYAASHDLQEPLRSVSSFAQLLDRRYRDNLDETANYYLSSIVDGAGRMRELIVGLLEYSQVSAEADDSPVPVDLNTVFDRVLQLVSSQIAEVGAQITRDSLPIVSGSEARLVQVFTNLISNALKYRSTAVPRIHVAAEQRTHEWLLSVKDNGVGFSPDSAEVIFRVFHRLHSRKVPGNGIGLALCRTIIERSGGRIWAESQPSIGSVFYFTLPAATTNAGASLYATAERPIESSE